MIWPETCGNSAAIGIVLIITICLLSQLSQIHRASENYDPEDPYNSKNVSEAVVSYVMIFIAVAIVYPAV